MSPILLALAVVPVFYPQPSANTPLAFAVDRATLILDVEVVEAQSFLQAGRIWTSYRMEVHHSMTGEVIDEVLSTMPGGVIDGEHQQLPGFPLLYVGQELLVMPQHDETVVLQQVIGLEEHLSPLTGEVATQDLVPVGPLFEAPRVDLVVHTDPDDDVSVLATPSLEDARRVVRR